LSLREFVGVAMERSTELEAFARRMYEMMKAGDGVTIAGLVPDEDGVVFVGTDQAEWWDTTDVIRTAFREQMDASGGFPWEGEDPRAYVDGNVGWFSDRPSMRMPDGTALPMRMTGVARRVDGEWRLVQGHLSVATDVNSTLFED